LASTVGARPFRFRWGYDATANPSRLVGAGLALPLSFVRGVERGQGKPSPYETRELFAKKPRIHAIAMQKRGGIGMIPVPGGSARPLADFGSPIGT